MILPQKFCVYRGVGGKFGALQFSWNPIHSYCTACKRKNYQDVLPLCQCAEATMVVREGNVFIEAASTVGPNKYDWDNKIIMALDINDMAKLARAFKNTPEDKPFSMLHDPGAGTDNKGQRQKVLQFACPKGPEAGGMFTLSEVNKLNNESTKKHTVPVSAEDCAIISTLFQTAIPRCIGWC